jgi:hypothetical protein
MTPTERKKETMKSLIARLLQNMSPVEARRISQGDSTIAPWLISKVFDALAPNEAEALALDVESMIASWSLKTNEQAYQKLLDETASA